MGVRAPNVAGAAPGSGAGGTGATGVCTALNPLQRRLWRLSVEQFQNSLKDLLQLATPPQLSNRGGEAQWAFFSDVSLGVDDQFQFALYQLVESVLPMIPASLTACTSGEAPTACATRIAKDFGAKAFRRPLAADEIAALVLPLVDMKSDRHFSEPNRWGTGELEEQALKPKLVVEVRYDKLEKHRFRHGTKLIRFRPDKDPKQCTWREVRPARRPGDLSVDQLLS